MHKQRHAHLPVRPRVRHTDVAACLPADQLDRRSRQRLLTGELGRVRRPAPLPLCGLELVEVPRWSPETYTGGTGFVWTTRPHVVAERAQLAAADRRRELVSSPS